MKKIATVFVSVLFVMALFAATNAGAGEVEYVGVKRCKACHFKQYRAWKKTSMATSFDNLKKGAKVAEKKAAGLEDKDYTHDENCLPCHTTGYGKPGGFVSIEETPKMANVQCEGCHGPGSVYRKLMKKIKKKKSYTVDEMKSKGLTIPSEDKEGCLECHSDESPFNASVDAKYEFNFEERLENTHKHYPLKYKKD